MGRRESRRLVLGTQHTRGIRGAVNHGGERLSLGPVTFSSLADMLVLQEDQHAAATSTDWQGSRIELRFLEKVLGD